jgi:multidrug efflux pump subunit AcrA (membrane-fusion protein)
MKRAGLIVVICVALKAEEPHIRATGTIRAVRVATIQVPSIRGPSGRLTLTRIIPTGTMVHKDDVLAEFDSTQQFDDAREARSKVDDLGHQIEQLRAQYRSDAAKRSADLKSAQADLGKAEFELQKAEVLSEIDRLKNEAKVKSARARVASLQKSSHFHDLDEAAGIRILELQRDRQKLVLERTESNRNKLTVRAPLAGMAALENVWRNGSRGPFQEGDQAFPGQNMLLVFDPTDMMVVTQVDEPDGAFLARAHATAKVRLDAYPGAVFDAVLESASPVASTSVGSPIKLFNARFRILQHDPRLLPDLSASVEIDPAENKTK